MLATNLIAFRTLPKGIKVKIDRTMIFPVVSYRYETWSLILREVHKLRMFEDLVVRNLFRFEDVRGKEEWRKRNNQELHGL
jgi:hypothetical protein